MAGTAQKPATRVACFESYDPEAYGEIVHPNRYDWYLVTQWLPDLGGDAFIVVKVLRNELYYNPARNALRNECEMSMPDLAERCGLSRTKLFELFRTNAALGRFVQRIPQVQIKGDRPHRDVNAFRVAMTDPIHPDHEEAYARLLEQRGSEKLAESLPPRFRVKGRESYESGNGTHRTPMSPEIPPYESGNGTHMLPKSPESGQHKEEVLPSGDSVTKDSLPPAAEAPSHKCVPPEGEREGGGDAEHRVDPTATLWADALERLTVTVNKPTLETHLRPLRLLGVSEEEDRGTMATLACPSPFTRDWIEKRHQGHLETALSEALGRPVQVRLVPTAAVLPPKDSSA